MKFMGQLEEGIDKMREGKRGGGEREREGGREEGRKGGREEGREGEREAGRQDIRRDENGAVRPLDKRQTKNHTRNKDRRCGRVAQVTLVVSPVPFHVNFSIRIERKFEDYAHDSSFDGHEGVHVLIITGT